MSNCWRCRRATYLSRVRLLASARVFWSPVRPAGLTSSSCLVGLVQNPSPTLAPCRSFLCIPEGLASPCSPGGLPFFCWLKKTYFWTFYHCVLARVQILLKPNRNHSSPIRLGVSPFKRAHGIIYAKFFLWRGTFRMHIGTVVLLFPYWATQTPQ